jgi:hypothetical protein
LVTNFGRAFAQIYQQVIMIDGKTALKKRILAVYKNGLKFITQPNKDLFEPEHIAEVFEVRKRSLKKTSFDLIICGC